MVEEYFFFHKNVKKKIKDFNQFKCLAVQFQ